MYRSIKPVDSCKKTMKINPLIYHTALLIHITEILSIVPSTLPTSH